MEGTIRPKRERSNTTTLLEDKGLSTSKSLRFKENLGEAWETVADKYGNDNLSCDELKEVLSIFGWADQISDEALPVLVQHLDTDGDDRITFDEFMDGIKGFLSSAEEDLGDGSEEDDLTTVPLDDTTDPLQAAETSIDHDDDDVDKAGDNEDDEDKGQVAHFGRFFTQFDRDGDGRLERGELEELLDFLKAGKHVDGDEGANEQAEVIRVLAHQLLQTSANADDGQVTLEDFLNALRNISIALRDFSLNLPRKPDASNGGAKSLTGPKLEGDKEELARLRFENSSLLARQEQLERTLKQVGALNEKMSKEKRQQQDELDGALKKIKDLQHHREKAKELSEQVESSKEELTRLRKAEAELTRLTAKLRAEVEVLSDNREAQDQRMRSQMDDMTYTISVQNEALANLERSVEEKDRNLVELQEHALQLTAALKKATQEVKDLSDMKSELDIQLSQHQLQLTTTQAELTTLREKVYKLEVERKMIAGTAAAVAVRPPSLQAELEALRSNDKARDEEERQKREVLEREQRERMEREKAEREQQLQQLRAEEEQARRALETQMRREREERQKRDREREERDRAHETERQRERAAWQQALAEKEARVLQLVEEIKLREQERLVWTRDRQEALEAQLREAADQARAEGANEVRALREVIENAKRERQKLRLRCRELAGELERLAQELRLTQERYARLRRLRAREAQAAASANRAAASGLFATLFSCWVPVHASVPLPQTDTDDDGADGLGVPETTGDGAAQELRVIRQSSTSSKRRPALKQPLMLGGPDDDEDEYAEDERELAPVAGAGVGVASSVARVRRAALLADEGSGSSNVATPDTSEAEKDSPSEGERVEWQRAPSLV